MKLTEKEATRLGLPVEKRLKSRQMLTEKPDYPGDLMRHLKFYGLPTPVRELQFDTGGRKWRFDLAWPEHMVAVEVDGGVWTAGGGRHNRGQGFIDDCEKLNAAIRQGWAVYRLVPDHIKQGYAIDLLREVLK